MDLNRIRSFLNEAELSEESCKEQLEDLKNWMANPQLATDPLNVVNVIDLYNTSRKCVLHETHKDVALQIRALACFLLKRLISPGISESLDLLRCFSRTGHVLRGTCIDTQVIATPQKCFEEAIEIYKTVGLHHISKSKSGVDLQAICEDIWDAFEGHLCCLPLSSIDEMVEDIQELRMIIPYLPQNAQNFVKLIIKLAESHRKVDSRDCEATLLGTALELIETLDNFKKKSYKRTVLSRLVDVYVEMEWFDKAETCWRILMNPETPQGLVSGVNLYSKMKVYPKAVVLIEKLQELDNYDAASEATRMYSHAVGFEDATTIPLWETLKLNFPPHSIEIELDLAGELAFSKTKRLRQDSCVLIANVARRVAQLSPEQMSRLKKIIHDSSCNASNYDHHEELFCWTEVALLISNSTSERATCRRMMSSAKLKLGENDIALQFALDALKEEPSKKSLFAYFRVLVADGSSTPESLESIIVQLIGCDDFDVYDLVAFGKEAHQYNNQAMVLQVCETLGRLLSERILATSEMPQLPIGVLFQNMAQLNNSQVGVAEEVSIEKFMNILSDMLEVTEKMDPIHVDTSFGPPEVMEWFYGVCHNIGVNTQNWKCFTEAAKIAVQTKRLFPSRATKIHDREGKCMLAAICLRMKALDTLSSNELKEVASIIEVHDNPPHQEQPDVQDYLATSLFMIKIKLNDFWGKHFIEDYTKKMDRESMKFRKLGDYVFVASKTTNTEQKQTIQHMLDLREEKEFSPEDGVPKRIEKCENLTAGQELNLADLHLSVLPSQIMRMSTLRTLNLRNNCLISLPVDFVESFPLLETLNLAQNQLTHLPPDIGGLQKLKKCFIQDNHLKSLPMSLMSCNKLEELFAQHNTICEIPEEFALLSSLQSLSVADNELKTLPKALNSLVKLKLVDLSGNALTEVPEHLRRLHDRHAVLHSRQKRRELITRALKIKSAVKQSLKNHAREVSLALSK
ncbi:Aste57867_22987 [Aphanomyces stellatus]|uniref:Aste57867_22987 protein n=1 Tax=Aphanomyces stellatus TaxID=120398 RepID=A0A485LM04_9STRA|nr:hypothetical protein As57867_022916 [Aphanomyces stellatus]VFT99636.1 Aste57867_22987 [Aphanomyces stellatus]